MSIDNGNWMYVGQNLMKSLNQEEEECLAWEITAMLIGKAELLQQKKGMPLKPVKQHVKPNPKAKKKT